MLELSVHNIMMTTTVTMTFVHTSLVFSFNRLHTQHTKYNMAANSKISKGAKCLHKIITTTIIFSICYDL